MTFDDLRTANNERQKLWEASGAFSLEYLGCALAGEVGEACNVIKKLARAKLTDIGSKATANQLAEELADCIIYIDLIARREGIDLEDAVRTKFNAVSNKYNLGVRI